MADFERKSAMVSIDAHPGSPKGYYVNLGVPAVKRGSMVQHVDTGWAATHYPRW